MPRCEALSVLEVRLATAKHCVAGPVVLSKPETQRLFEKLETPNGRYELAAKLQYGAGLRLSELVRLRVQDVDPSPLRYAVASLERGTVTVRAGKGDPASLRYAVASKDRMTVLPQSLREELVAQAERARVLWSRKGLRPTRFGCEPGFICLVHWRGNSAERRRLSSGFGCFQPDRFRKSITRRSSVPSRKKAALHAMRRG